MSNDADIWMPFNVGDYLKDTSRLDTIGHGAYILLILDYWVSGGPLPDDDNQLKNITKLSSHNWKRHRQLIEKYFIVKDGLWHHKRIDEELAKALINMEKASARGKYAADVKHGNIVPGASPEDASSPSSSPSPKEKNSSENDLKDNRNEEGDLKIKAKTIFEIESIRGNWSVKWLEDKFNEMNREKIVKFPDAAFLAFVKKHVKTNGANP